VTSTAPALDPIDVFDPEALREPARTYARLRDEAPVFRVPGTSVHLVSTWELVQQAVTSTEEFSSHLHTIVLERPDGSREFDLWMDGQVEQVLAIADDPAHKAHRKVVLNALNRRIRSLDADIARICDDLWAQGVHGDRIDWTRDVADQLPIRVIAQLIGLPPADVPDILEMTYRTTELLGGIVEEERLASVLGAPLELWTYLETHFRRALDAPGDDLNGALAAACRSGDLEAETAVGILMQVINAGGESTAALIGNAARVLAEDPALAARVRDDPGALDRLVDEVLRVEGPFRGHYRHVPAATRLGGVDLAAGSTLLLLWGAANLDPRQFPDPERVDLDRPGVRGHLGFGRGAHFCVGSALARLETVAALRVLLRETTSFRLDPDDPPRWLPSLTMRRHEHLTLVLDRA